MRYRGFAIYNVTGAALWVVSVTLAGYQFGNIAWVKQDLTYVLGGIVLISVLPGAFQWIRKRRAVAH
jgi:membrane-associated protein